MKPYMIDHVENVGGQTVKKFLPSAYGTLMSANDAQFLTHLMSQVVEIGTGSAMRGHPIRWPENRFRRVWHAVRRHIPGLSVSLRADKPKGAICVLAEESGSGGAVAAPIARQVLIGILRRRAVGQRKGQESDLKLFPALFVSNMHSHILFTQPFQIPIESG